MTLQEVCQAIEAETHTRTWVEANNATRLAVIAGCMDEWEIDKPEQAGKKIKQRKPRKPKTVPLTQHAEGSE